MIPLHIQLCSITQEEAVDDYEKLCSIPKDNINERRNVGNKAMNHLFFKDLLRARNFRGTTFEEWLSSDERTKPYYVRAIKYKTDRRVPLIKAEYDVYRMYGGGYITAFKPITAMKLYQRYNPKTILDFSAGWGGRCIGAMALGKNYIGFDTNDSLATSYEKMLELYNSTGNVEINFEDSSKVDYSKYTYDMVFTSPPYFRRNKPTENYENMPDYKNREDFFERFFRPVIRNTYDNLASGGTYALNIPIDMYDEACKILGKATEEIPMFKALKSNGDRKRRGEYKESIYIWKKENTLPPHSWKHDHLTVRDSKIPNAGKGVFALHNIKRGTRLADYIGIQMTKKEFAEKYPSDKRFYYSLGINGVIDGHNHREQNISHYINESNSPNVCMRKRGLYALCDITEGDELYLKYPRDYSRNY